MMETGSKQQWRTGW